MKWNTFRMSESIIHDVRCLIRQSMIHICRSRLNFSSQLHLKATIEVSVDHQETILMVINDLLKPEKTNLSDLELETSDSLFEMPSDVKEKLQLMLQELKQNNEKMIGSTRSWQPPPVIYSCDVNLSSQNYLLTNNDVYAGDATPLMHQPLNHKEILYRLAASEVTGMEHQITDLQCNGEADQTGPQHRITDLQHSGKADQTDSHSPQTQPCQLKFDQPCGLSLDQPLVVQPLLDQPRLPSPNQPLSDQSSQPLLDEPSQPSLDQQSRPLFDQPLQPSFVQSLWPSLDQPCRLSLDQPCLPSLVQQSRSSLNQPSQLSLDKQSRPSLDQPCRPSLDERESVVRYGCESESMDVMVETTDTEQKRDKIVFVYDGEYKEDGEVDGEDIIEYKEVEEDVEAEEDIIDMIVQEDDQDEALVEKERYLLTFTRDEVLMLTGSSQLNKIDGKYLCSECGFETEHGSAMKIHAKSHEKIVQCDHCDEMFSSITAAKIHMAEEHKAEVKAKVYPPNSCRDCQTKFANREELVEHMVHDHDHLLCSRCDFSTISVKKLEKHMLKHGSKVTCHVCHLEVNDKLELEKHIEVEHRPVSSVTCKICGENQSGPLSLKEHVRTRHEGHSCDGCTYTCATPLTLHKHQSYHDINRLTCTVCSANHFVCRIQLKKHMRKLHPLERRKKKCEFCNKIFMSRQGLHTHRRTIHHDQMSCAQQETFTCHCCGKEFLVFKYLKSHLKTHESTLPYKCPKCDKMFKYHRNYKSHLQGCINPGGFPCHFCGKSLKNEYNLRLHCSRKHPIDPTPDNVIDPAKLTDSISMIQPPQSEAAYLACQKCGMPFVQLQTLLEHEKQCGQLV